MNITYKHSFNISHGFGLVVILLISLFMSNQALANKLTSVIDRTNIAQDESITLKVILDSVNVNGQPNFSGLEQNFDIVSNNVSSQKSIINGDVTASTEWRMVLFPKRAGQLLIPPFSFQGAQTKPITVTVSQSQASTQSGTKPDIFLETDIDKSDIYVQEQVIITYRLFFSRSVRSLDKEDIKVDNLRVQELPRADYQKSINSKTYGVAEFRFALIPDASGKVTIPAQTWTIESTDQASNRFGFNGGRRELHRVKTAAITFDVKPKPDNYPLDATWLPANNINIAETWSQSPEQFKVGEPITRTVTLAAEGLSAEQLPPIFSEQEVDGFKFYPDKPNIENQTTGAGLAGTRTESIAIVPTRSGTLTLPEISVTWWDGASKSIQKATLPARNVTIAAAAATTVPAVTTIPSNLLPPQETTSVIVEKQSYLWLFIACLSLLLNAVLIVLWWNLRQSKRQDDEAHDQHGMQQAHNIKQAFAGVTQACKIRNPQQLRTAVLTWATIKWPHHSISRLQDIIQIANDDGLKNELERLNAALFAQHSGNVDYERMLNLLQKIPHEAPATSKKTTLQPLYGT